MATNRAHETAVLTEITKGTAIPSTGVPKIGLATAGTPTTGVFTEVSGSGYTKVTVPYASWNTPVTGAVTNSAEVRFPQMTAPWGTITHWVLFNSNDEPLYVFPLQAPRSNDPAGTELRFNPGELMMTIQAQA